MKQFGLRLSCFLRKRSVKGKSVPFDKAKNIGILLYNPDFNKNKEINQFVSVLQKAGKQVEIICFLDKSVNRLYDFPYLEVRDSDINYIGGFKNEKINKFIKTPFDYLYSINNSPFLPFENILCRSESNIRIGKFFPGCEKYLDLMIQMNENASLSDLLKKMNELVPKLSFHE